VSGIVSGLRGDHVSEQEAGKISAAGLSIMLSLDAERLCLLFYPATRPWDRNSCKFHEKGYPHFHRPIQKKKEQKEKYCDDGFAALFYCGVTYKTRREELKTAFFVQRGLGLLDA